ncbi:hypothetical protein CYLTODRAFT_402095 [Cylindrobasidium torrendii FP15055 ss-10]|uniref:DUF6534 domain-containing protein n=1 Tax=Cylindrobasidium torrendii FP15055 ss-10 TaxID=1314674 RepID=A0A0D7B0W6_9AGAR|nr:hypothetical protein CYLTODRAFT_402095 [Cylindrobasidium torrendii FP15055 ss-10]
MVTCSHGPMLIGMMFNLMLFGVVLTQTYIYLTTYKRRDKLWIQLFVLALLVANVLNTVFLSTDMYLALVTNFDNPAYLANSTWLFVTDPILTGIVATACQIFFCWRVKVLTSSWMLAGGVAVVATAGFLGAMLSAAHAVLTPAFLGFPTFKGLVILWLVSACAADVAISGIMVWYLRKHKTGFERSDELVDRIVRVTVQTGMITSVAAIVDMIVFLVDPSGLHLLFNVVLIKLYTNTLLSSLNSRGGWQFSGSNGGSNSQSGNMVSTIGGSAVRKKRTVTTGGPVHSTRPEVFVHVEHVELQDASSGPPFSSDDNKSVEQWDAKANEAIV